MYANLHSACPSGPLVPFQRVVSTTASLRVEQQRDGGGNVRIFRLHALFFFACSVIRLKVYIPAMKQFVLEFKNLAGQQRGAASVSTASESSC